MDILYLDARLCDKTRKILTIPVIMISVCEWDDRCVMIAVRGIVQSSNL